MTQPDVQFGSVNLPDDASIAMPAVAPVPVTEPAMDVAPSIFTETKIAPEPSSTSVSTDANPFVTTAPVPVLGSRPLISSGEPIPVVSGEMDAPVESLYIGDTGVVILLPALSMLLNYLKLLLVM